MKKLVLALFALAFLAACAGPSVKRVQTLSETADAPYDNVLVVSLFESFDVRRIFEAELVKQLKSQGINAVASTSKSTGKTPVNRDTFLAMIAELDSDSVLVTQLVNLNIDAEARDRRPEATYNVRPGHSYYPTYYYHNVWSVELTEYREPPALELEYDIVMATQVFSAHDQESVWTIESHSRLKSDVDRQTHGTSIIAEAKAIVKAMSRDGLLAR